jgi:hypothetical protein
MKVMYDKSFHAGSSGQLASHYVPYIEDAIEETDGLLRYFQFEFLNDDNKTFSLIWVNKVFIKK